MSNYLLGNVIRLSVSFKDLAGVAADPTTVVLTVKRRTSTNETLTPTKDSVGNYHYDYTPAAAGAYFYRFNGTGALVAATQGQFTIDDPQI
jgi:hypothetical protein